jgi:hypothetical protein
MVGYIHHNGNGDIDTHYYQNKVEIGPKSYTEQKAYERRNIAHKIEDVDYPGLKGEVF